MTLPLRFVATSYNLWAGNRWPEREEALRAYLRDAQPDLLCVQELRPFIHTVVDEALPGHDHIKDDFEGWTNEGNIYWSRSMFEYVEHGAEEVGMLEKLRRLFWVRLKVKGTNRTVVVSTIHFTWPGNAREAQEGYNPRPEQARQALAALDRLVQPDEPALLMGDLNEALHALAVLRKGGFSDSFAALGTLPRATHPATPTAAGTLPQVIDWQFHRGPIRAMTSEVVDYFCKDLAPSDHKPVTVTYGMEL